MKNSILKNVGKEIVFSFRFTSGGYNRGKIIRVDEKKRRVRLRYDLFNGKRRYEWFSDFMIMNIMPYSGRRKEWIDRCYDNMLP